MEFNFKKGQYNDYDPKDPGDLLDYLKKHSPTNWKDAVLHWNTGLFVSDENVVHLQHGWPASHGMGMAFRVAKSMGFEPNLIMAHPSVHEEFMDNPKIRQYRRVQNVNGKMVIFLFDIMFSTIYDPDIFVMDASHFPPNKNKFVRVVREETILEPESEDPKDGKHLIL
jgi:hypothetical protein